MSRRRLTAPALACLAALALAGCRSGEGQLESAAAARRRGEPRVALATYQSLLASLGELPLPAARAAVRLKALRGAGDVAYLELGDYASAIAYYRRVISLAPGSPEAMEARGVIGDIFRDRFQDRQAAIAQYADVAQGDGPQAPLYQLKVAREYLELGNAEQARAEARTVRERWPESKEADEAQLVTAQAWALETREDEALRAFQALIDRHPAPELVARALEGQAHLLAQVNKFDRAIELYTEALASHPNPDAIRTNLESVRRRREAAKTVTPGNRNEAFDYGQPKPPAREITP
jgi:tetratricopeptide (TPR) repeat protein